MSIKFRCKNCGDKYLLDDVLAGESFRCEACGAYMRVPRKSAELDTVVADDASPEILDGNSSRASTGPSAAVKVHSAAGASQKADDIKFACKRCGQKYRLAKELAGHEAECANCKRILIIPEHSDGAPEDSQTKKIVFWCKSCGQKYRLPQNYAHNSAHCSRCKADLVVPAASENAPLPEAVKEQPGGIDMGRPPLPPEQTEWLQPLKPKNYKEIQEEKQALNKTRAQVVQELISKSLQTQTSVEVTGNPVSMVRYVLASPDRGIVVAFSALIGWIRRFPGLKHFPRKLIGTFIILGCIAAAAAVAVRIYQSMPETRLVNSMCLDCHFIEARTLSNINKARCSKCNGELGYAWKCYKCGKVFSKAVGLDDENVLHLDNIRPPACPICNSEEVKYLNPETPPTAKSGK